MPDHHHPSTPPRLSALDVVTAVLCTAQEFPGELGADCPAVCASLRVSARLGGYGVLLCQDAAGARWTMLTDGVEGVASTCARWASGLVASCTPRPKSVLVVLGGWPVECGLGLVDRDQPHDPASAGVALHPPDMSGWGPAPRRQMTDRVADEFVGADRPG